MTDSKIKIEAFEDGALRLTSDEDFGAIETLTVKEVEALRAHFQAERDKELDWWRASLEFVVRLRPGKGIEARSVTVLNERLGITTTVWEGAESRSEYGIAARAYFEAHPEPKSWHDASPGEVWMLTMEGEERPAIVRDDRYFDAPSFIVSPESVRITAGCRLWPVDEEGDGDE